MGFGGMGSLAPVSLGLFPADFYMPVFTVLVDWMRFMRPQY